MPSDPRPHHEAGTDIKSRRNAQAVARVHGRVLGHDGIDAAFTLEPLLSALGPAAGGNANRENGHERYREPLHHPSGDNACQRDRARQSATV